MQVSLFHNNSISPTACELPDSAVRRFVRHKTGAAISQRERIFHRCYCEMRRQFVPYLYLRSFRERSHRITTFGSTCWRAHLVILSAGILYAAHLAGRLIRSGTSTYCGRRPIYFLEFVDALFCVSYKMYIRRRVERTDLSELALISDAFVATALPTSKDTWHFPRTEQCPGASYTNAVIAVYKVESGCSGSVCRLDSQYLILGRPKGP